MNLRITFLMLACCSLQLYGMDEIEQAMRNCKMSKVHRLLTAEALGKDPVRFGNAAYSSSCPEDMTRLLFETWSKKNPNNGLRTKSFALTYNAAVNKTATPSQRGKNHYFELQNNKSELIFLITQQINS